MSSNEHVQISDFSDRELMAVIAGMTQPVSAREVASRIFGVADIEEHSQEMRHYARCVISRFAWMKRYGLIDRDEEGLWSISPEGEALRNGRLASAVESGIRNGKESSALALANIVGERLVGASKGASGLAMRRELQFQLTRRRSIERGW
jgi:hypothetical protein